jgi:hypothetical protein
MLPVEPVPGEMPSVPPGQDMPPVKEPEPEYLPDEVPVPNPDENDKPPNVL